MWPNSKCDKKYKIKWKHTSNTKIVTEHKASKCSWLETSNCDYTKKKLKWWQNLKTSKQTESKQNGDLKNLKKKTIFLTD